MLASDHKTGVSLTWIVLHRRPHFDASIAEPILMGESDSGDDNYDGDDGTPNNTLHVI